MLADPGGLVWMMAWHQLMRPLLGWHIPLGVLLLHGFSGGPDTYKALEPALRQLGLPLAVPRLRGHGEASPQALAGITWADWLADASTALAALRAEAGPENGTVIVVGHSMGALLALLLAADQPTAIDSLVLVATPLQLRSPLAPGRPLGVLVPLLGRLLRRWPLPKNYADAAQAAADSSYPWVPMDALLSFLELIGVARRRLCAGAAAGPDPAQRGRPGGGSCGGGAAGRGDQHPRQPGAHRQVRAQRP